MSAPVVWLLAVASAALLVTGGFALAVVRFRARARTLRHKTRSHQAALETRAEDPFGELQVITDQLRRIDLRLGKTERVAGLPSGAVPATDSETTPEPDSAGGVTAELEQDLDLFKREVYSKTQRIDALLQEKQTLADKVVTLETALGEAEVRSEAAEQAVEAKQEAARAEDDPEGSTALMDVLQQESDDLRVQLTERDRLIETLEKGDQTGLLHELQRIRQELLDRNEEVAGLTGKLSRSVEKLEQQTTRASGLEREKEALAAKALESAAQLRQAKERAYALEQAQGEPDASQPLTSTAPLPAPLRIPLPTPQGAPLGGPPSGAPPPPVPPPSRTPAPQTPPPRRSGSSLGPPRSGDGSNE